MPVPQRGQSISVPFDCDAAGRISAASMARDSALRASRGSSRSRSRSKWGLSGAFQIRYPTGVRDSLKSPLGYPGRGSVALTGRMVMGMRRRGPLDGDAFVAFVDSVKPALVQALVATYGPVDGREAAVDALSWAWEHWDRVADIEHPVRYLYRVGQSATRRFLPKPLPHRLVEILETRSPDVEPGLLPALKRLSERQRTVVLLVHGYAWPQIEVAALLEVSPSTVADHLSRALTRLRNELEVDDVRRRD